MLPRPKVSRRAALARFFHDPVQQRATGFAGGVLGDGELQWRAAGSQGWKNIPVECDGLFHQLILWKGILRDSTSGIA